MHTKGINDQEWIEMVYDYEVYLRLNPTDQFAFNLQEFLLLIGGGFLITGCANGFNQILESDYDKLMIRTEERPLPLKKISSSSAIIFTVLIGILGFYFLSLIL